MAKRWAVGSWICILLLAVAPVWAQGNNASSGGQADNASSGRWASGPNFIADGTRFIVLLDNNLDTAKLKTGQQFKAKLAEDLTAPNGLTIPRGKKIKGHVSEITRGLHGRILLSFDQIETQHGWMPLAATVTGVPGEHGVKSPNEEGEIERQGPDKRRVMEAAVVGAGAGAVAGGAAKGASGAVIGAVAGGVLGGTAGMLIGGDLKLNKGQQLELTLDRPLQVPAH